MTVRVMMKMQVAVYWPVVEGVQYAEKSGVLVDAKRVPIPDIGLISGEEDMSIAQNSGAMEFESGLRGISNGS